ncbi:restriction endonuclease subunit S [Prosthecobacter sp.]|uniref:restriction endonuclease subunit S n=1 Tax=Prosthecobacter sp. TaxID=1965333 RepID=UPI002AB9AD79|nr:restriction endonuclease subunit S [Prosthecobacter sp.]MDZ4401113.1 restriction endonuclease subunit S [Prosthecobacter sp.]
MTMAKNGSDDWQTAKLGDVIELFDTQRVPLNSGERQQRQGIYPYYGAQGIIDHIDGYIFDGRYILVAEDGENLNSKKLPLALFADGKFWVNNHAHILRGKPGVADDTFLLACLNNADIKPYVTGAAQPKLSQGNLRQIEIPLPPLPAQRRIAGILSAYDELIENSQRRIRLLEDMARALYREWFVHFRFPGHESVPRVPSALGDIPQGWEVKKLGDIVELNYGKALKKEDRREGEFPVFGSSGQVGSHDTSLVKGPGIIVGRKGNVGSVFWCDGDFFVIDTAYFVTSALPLRFLFYVLPTLNFINSDAAVPGLSRNQAYTLEVAVPPAALLTKFCELAETLEKQASTLQRQIQILRRTRDLLLPRLLSGEMNIEIN